MIFIGLRNKGSEYKRTRHNAGSILLEYLQNQNLLNESEVYLPNTFMNLSGEYVKKVLKKSPHPSPPPRGEGKVQSAKFAVFFDDVTLPVGKYKISVGEGASSHNGIRSIVENIKSLGLTKDDFVRVRIGIGKTIQDENGKESLYELGPENLSDFVLSNLNNLEIAQIQSLGKEILKKISGD